MIELPVALVWTAVAAIAFTLGALTVRVELLSKWFKRHMETEEKTSKIDHLYHMALATKVGLTPQDLADIEAGQWKLPSAR